MRLNTRSRVLLPQPEGPMKAVTFSLRDLQVDLLQRLELAVVEIEVAHDILGFSPAATRTRVSMGLSSVSCCGRARAPGCSAPARPRVIRNTPAHASFCQFSYGLIANLKIVTGRLAIGSRRSIVQNWLDSAVKSKRRRLAGNTRQRQQDARDDAGTRRLQGHGGDHLPLRRAQRVGRFAQRVGDQAEHVLGGADDDRE